MPESINKNAVKIARKKRLGLCLRCENPPRPGKQTCEDCVKKIQAYNKKRAWKRICRDCPKRAVQGKKRCAECLRVYADKALQKQKARKAAGICIQCGLVKVTKYLRCIDCRTENSARKSGVVEDIPNSRSDAHLPKEETIYGLGV
jgi:hypothetical protein